MPEFRTLCITIAGALVLAAAPSANAVTHGDLESMDLYLDIVNEYLSMIDYSHKVSADAEKSAVLHMQRIQEVYEERGEKALAADVYRSILKDSRNATIRRAAYIFLADILKETGQTDEALKVLREGLNEIIKASN